MGYCTQPMRFMKKFKFLQQAHLQQELTFQNCQKLRRKYFILTCNVHRPPPLASNTTISDWISRILWWSSDCSTLTIIEYRCLGWNRTSFRYLQNPEESSDFNTIKLLLFLVLQLVNKSLCSYITIGLLLKLLYFAL